MTTSTSGPASCAARAGVPREHANPKPTTREATDQHPAERPGPAGNQDHDLLAGSRTTARRTASFTSAVPSSTGSR